PVAAPAQPGASSRALLYPSRVASSSEPLAEHRSAAAVRRTMPPRGIPGSGLRISFRLLAHLETRERPLLPVAPSFDAFTGAAARARRKPAAGHVRRRHEYRVSDRRPATQRDNA